MTWASQHRRFRFEFDFEELRPELPGDKKMIVGGIVRNAVQHGLGAAALSAWQKAGEVEESKYISCLRRDAHDAIRMPDVGIYLAVDVLQFIQVVDRLPISVTWMWPTS